MTNHSATLVSKLWNYCSILRNAEIPRQARHDKDGAGMATVRTGISFLAFADKLA